VGANLCAITNFGGTGVITSHDEIVICAICVLL